VGEEEVTVSPVTNKVISMKTLIIKSLLTSLCQREVIPLFGEEGQGEIFQ
jgi:hypothetical protein